LTEAAASLSVEQGSEGGAELAEDALRPQSAKAQTRSDSELIEQFVQERCPSGHTEQNYRASLRRLGWFCDWIGLQSVRQLQRHQWALYRAYLRDPPADHIMAHRSLSYGALGWRPFRGRLSESSAKQSEVIAKVFFGWMADPAVGAIAHSPVASIRTHAVRRSATESGVHRFLPGPVWPYIDQALLQWPAETLYQQRSRARAQWVVALAVRTGLRASEISNARFGSLQPSSLHPGKYNLHVTRKGGVVSALPVLPEVVRAYRAYLDTYDLRGYDLAELPMVLPVRLGKKTDSVQPTSRSYIWRIVKDVMQSAGDLAMEAGDEIAQARLQQASTHWLRHTFATDLFDSGADVLSVRDLMDHASISTTSRYLHRPEERLRADLERLSRDPSAAQED
jgi:site-specific recombinase XerD